MEATATLPRFCVIQSNYNNQYLQHHVTSNVPNIAFQFGGGNIFDLSARLEMVPATTGGGLYNIRSMHNNKFLSHLGDGNMWITAVSAEPVEDQNSKMCTLFKPVLVNLGGDNKTIRLRHVKTGCYACLWRVGPPFKDCLYTAVPTDDGSGCDVYTVINWELTDPGATALVAEKQALEKKVSELTSRLEECRGSKVGRGPAAVEYNSKEKELAIKLKESNNDRDREKAEKQALQIRVSELEAKNNNLKSKNYFFNQKSI